MAQHVLHAVLASDNQYKANVVLLKKIIIATAYGRLLINGQSPDSSVSLGEYLVDDERLIIDLKLLTPENNARFKHWLLDDHELDATSEYINQVITNEYRGYTAEMPLSYWGRLLNLLFFRKKTKHWELAPLELTLAQQIKGIDILEDKLGLVVGFNQLGHGPVKGRYGIAKHPEKLQGNVKRVMITNDMVEEMLAQFAGGSFDYHNHIDTPHILSIKINDKAAYYQAMYDYRGQEKLIKDPPQYKRLWRWLISVIWDEIIPWYKQLKRWLLSFIWHEENTEPSGKSEVSELDIAAKAPFNGDDILDMSDKDPFKGYDILYQDDNILIVKHRQSGKCIVREMRPNIDTAVFSGGGGKIFGHVGAIDAFDESGLKIKCYAGSSAGAIIALFGYLGYTGNEIQAFFEQYNGSNLVYITMNKRNTKTDSQPDKIVSGIKTVMRAVKSKISNLLKGLSPTDALETALNKSILNKINTILKENGEAGTQYKRKHPIPVVGVTYKYLSDLKRVFPDCGIADELVVPATNLTDQRIDYFSTKLTPNKPVAKTVTASAAMPLLYEPVVIEGKTYTDAGVGNNLCVDHIKENGATFLCSDHEVSLSLLAIQFDNGTEIGALYKLERVYKENPFFAWIISLLTGFKDAVVGFEQDRIKLQRMVPLQTVLIPADISSRTFTVDEKTQKKLRKAGFDSTNFYLTRRYCNEENKEFLSQWFSSDEALLCYAASRGNKKIFEALASVSTLDAKRVQALSDYLKKTHHETVVLKPKNVAKQESFQEAVVRQSSLFHSTRNLALYHLLEPLVSVISNEWVDPKEQSIIRKAKFYFSISNPLSVLNIFRELQGNVHILLHILCVLLENTSNLKKEQLEAYIDKFNKVLANRSNFNEAVFFNQWNFGIDKVDMVLSGFLSGIVDAKACVEILAPAKLDDKPIKSSILGKMGFFVAESGHWLNLNLQKSMRLL